MENRLKKGDFVIGALYLPEKFADEKHVKEISECGIDMIMTFRTQNVKTLDVFEKYSVGCDLAGIFPQWWGGKGENRGTLSSAFPLSALSNVPEDIKDHPAVWALDLGDEPCMLDFPHYSKLFTEFSKRFPEKMPFLNLYANYGINAKATKEETAFQLGTDSYEEYIENFAKTVPSDVIMFDHYMFSSSLDKALDNFRVVTDACKKYGKKPFVILQLASSEKDTLLSETELKTELNIALSFGVRSLFWASYGDEWWHGNAIDKNGEKTEQYEKLKRTNLALKEFLPEYAKYTVENTYRSFACKNTHPVTTNLSSVLVAEMTSPSSEKALLVSSLLDPDSTDSQLVTLPDKTAFSLSPGDRRFIKL